MANIFISYPHEAARDASQFADALKAQGLDTWFAEENLYQTEDCKSQIQEALHRADAVAFIFLPNFQASSWLQYEYMSALESYWAGNKKLLVPVVLGEIELPGFLRQWASVKIEKKSDWNKAANQIREWLNSNQGPSSKALKKAKDQRNQRLKMITRVLEASSSRNAKIQPKGEGTSLAAQKRTPIKAKK